MEETKKDNWEIIRQYRDKDGNVDIDKNFLATSFNEKKKKLDYINAGVYLFHKNIFSLISEGTFCSLEEEVLPELVKFQSLYGFPIKGKVIDIGTEERYANISR